MRALGDLPSQVKLAIYQLIEDRSKAELVFPSFKEIAQQLELETAGAGLMLMTDDCEHAPMMSMLSQMLLDDDMLGLLPTTEFAANSPDAGAGASPAGAAPTKKRKAGAAPLSEKLSAFEAPPAGAAPTNKRKAGAAPLSGKQQSVYDAGRLAAAAAEKDRIGAGDEPEPVPADTKGVYWSKDIRKWRARLQVDGRELHLGMSESKAVCVAARKAAVAALSAFEAPPAGAAPTNKRKAGAAPLSGKQQSVYDAGRLAAAAAEKDRIGAGDEPEPVPADTKGVYWSKDIRKWRARLQVDGRELHLGMSESKAVCVAARKAAVAALSGAGPQLRSRDVVADGDRVARVHAIPRRRVQQLSCRARARPA